MSPPNLTARYWHQLFPQRLYRVLFGTDDEVTL